MARVQLSVSVSPRIADYVERTAALEGIKKSKVVERALYYAWMKEGYESMDEVDREVRDAR